MRALWRGIRQRSAGSAGSAAIHHSTAFLSSKTQLHLALCILNVELQHDLSVQSSIFTHLWREAGVRVCADGAANRLHDSLADADRDRLLPDLIKGDLDSIRDDVAAFYRRLGVPLERDAETDRHDFDKCLRWLEKRQEKEQPATPFSVVALGVRVPAPFAARAPPRAPPPARAASAHPRRTRARRRSAGGSSRRWRTSTWRTATPAPSSASSSSLMTRSRSSSRQARELRRGNNNATARRAPRERTRRGGAPELRPARTGANVIEPNRDVEGGTCGLVPIGGPCERVLTSGLRWDLDGSKPLEFGGLVSSSNEVRDDAMSVTVHNSSPLLWISSLVNGSKGSHDPPTGA